LDYYLHEKAWDYFMMPRMRERAPFRQLSYGRERTRFGGLSKVTSRFQSQRQG
jgi:hypothetical protein